MSRCCRCPPLRQQRKTNAREWYTISGVARTLPPLKYPSGSAVELHPEEDGWLAAGQGSNLHADLFVHAVKPGGGLEAASNRRTFALRGLWLYLAGGRFDSGVGPDTTEAVMLLVQRHARCDAGDVTCCPARLTL